MADRGDYRSFYCAFWDNVDTHALSDRGYRVLTTLKGTLNAAGIGIVYVAQLAERCGKTTAEILTGYTELETAKPDADSGWIIRERNIVWVVNGLRYEPSLTPNNKLHRAFVRDRCLAPLGDVPIVAAFRRHYPEWFTDASPEPKRTLSDASPKGIAQLSKQSPIQATPNQPNPSLSNPVQSKPATTSPVADAPALLVAAANRGISEAFGEQPNPIRWDAGTTLQAIEVILSAGVPVEFARDAIYTHARETRDQIPRTLKFFTAYVIDRWRADQAKQAAAGSDAKALPSVNGSGGASVSFVGATKHG